MINQRQKLRPFFCALLVMSLLFSTSPVFAETVQDVPVGETTISSKAEDPLKEYKERAQNQVPMVESVESQDVPGKTSEIETSPTEIEETTGESPTSTNESSEEQPEITNQRIEPRGGGIVPLAGTILREGNFGDDPSTYDIDKKFADAIRSNYSWMSPPPPNPMTDDFMERLTNLSVGSSSLTSLKGIEYATNLTRLDCDRNQLTELDVSSNTKLVILYCDNNQLSELDVSNNPALSHLICFSNQLSDLEVNSNPALEYLDCGNTGLTELDVSDNPALKTLECYMNPLTELDVSSNPSLLQLNCLENQLIDVNVSNNPALENLNCGNNRLTKLDVSSNPALKYLDCSHNRLTELDVSSNPVLEFLHCSSNQLSELDISNNLSLLEFTCGYNQLSTLNVSNHTLLKTIRCFGNRISDISSANGLTALTIFDASNQKITVPVPPVSLTGEATVDILKTTAQTGITATNVDINPTPVSILPNAINGDLIDLTGVTRDSLTDKSIRFSYDSSALQEGATNYYEKMFSGIITFAVDSDLENELQVSSNKTKSGEELTWTWTITSLTQKKAEDIKATLNYPNYVTGDISDIVITKGASSVAGDMNHLNGTTSLGDLEQGESIVITFKSIVKGDPDTWYEAIGRLDWSDTTPSSPHFNEAKQQFKILDEEQTDTPKDSKDMGILSVPIYFNFGMQDIDSTLQTYSLHTLNYQSNTNVVTDGFYTRVKDERSSNTGWELTASLSEFVDKSGIGMPNGSGTSLKLDNMSIEKVTNRDTPQEGIDPSPSGTPSTVKTTETLVAGDAAKTLVDAGASEGDGTWQLRMPFTDLSLNVPANAGKKGTVYQAKLTWSLNSTP